MIKFQNNEKKQKLTNYICLKLILKSENKKYNKTQKLIIKLEV